MYSIHKSVDIDFAHQVRGHSGACVGVHGHTWKFEVGLAAATLDAEGFVTDFGELKRQVLLPCHQLLDHSLAVGPATWAEGEAALEMLGTTLLSARLEVHGPDAALTTSGGGATDDLAGARNVFPGGMKVAVFPFDPTSERLAAWLWRLADARLADERVRVVWARVYETLHPVAAVAEYRPDS